MPEDRQPAYRKQEKSMKAVRLHAYGGVECLRYEDVPEPSPQEGEVLVKVAATSVNPVDWKLRRGDLRSVMPLALPAILGRDVAGTVAALGANVKNFRPGDRVMGFVNQAYAEFLVARGSDLTLIPHGFQLEDAAALPLVVLSGVQLIEQGVQPQAGQTVLVTGALGGVGRTAVYVARKHGAKVIAGVRARQRKEAQSLGADQILALDDDDAIEALDPVDAIADTVGQPVIGKLMPRLRPHGVLATLLGKPPDADGGDFRVVEIYTQQDARRLGELAKAVANGEFAIPISRRMQLSQAGQAQQLAEAGGISKILLQP
jgi:NADPH:quinone reductase-like Zn-dependent oxidoreductase